MTGRNGVRHHCALFRSVTQKGLTLLCSDVFSGSDSSTHDFTIEHRVFMVFKKYWLYQDIYFSDVFPEVSPLLPFVCDFSLSDNHGNVYIAI